VIRGRGAVFNAGSFADGRALFLRLATVLFGSSLLVACASKTTVQENDPFEPTNRAIFDVNDSFDKAIALPAAKAYVDVVPAFARNGVHNFLVNLNSPVVFANDVLQGEVERAGQTLARAGINSTVGLGGLIDVAADIDLPPHTEDFGQTLGVWGTSEGPYLVLPFLGPSNPRDAVGMGVDLFFDPLTYADYDNKTFWSIMRGAGSALDLRSQNIDSLDAVERSSIDYYAALRSLYRQQRNNEIHNNNPNAQPLPEY
jgi:phospholipid-binding lipoprotein MlaA